MLWFMLHGRVGIWILLHIMCGYQCDKSMNKNDTREVIYDIISLSEMISYHFTGLNCPIK